MAEIELRLLDFEISFQRRGLAYLDISKWSAVQINANRAGFSFGRERLRMPARRRLCSSSVRIQRAGLADRIWEPKWGFPAAYAMLGRA